MRAKWLALFVVALGWSFALVGPAAAAKVQRVSVSTAGAQSNESHEWGSDGSADISPDGRYVAFESGATDLWPVDGNTDPNRYGGSDIFLRDRTLGTTELVSRNNAGEPGNGDSFFPFVTADGRYVFFCSTASNLVAPAPPSGYPLYVRDRQLSTTALVPLTSSGGVLGDHYVVGDVTPDGRYLLFSTGANNVVPGDTDGEADVFLRDRVAGTTEYAGLGNDGQPFAMSGGGKITPDGRYVAFVNIGGLLYVRDRLLEATAQVSQVTWVDLVEYDLNPNARDIVFMSWDDSLVPGDTNQCADVFLRDRQLGTTERVSVSSAGGQGQWPDITGTPRRAVRVSADGRYVAFSIESQRLVPSDNNDLRNVFLRDRVDGTTILVDATPEGLVSSSWGDLYAMSDDGGRIAIVSLSDNFVPGDTNNARDTFVWDRDARFFDVPSCFWAFPAIEACVAAEIVSGYPDVTYRPAKAVSRDQMAVYISRSMAGGDSNVPAGPDTATFYDVPTNHWAYKYVEYAVAHGIVSGFGEGEYRPNLTVTRDAMAVFVARAMCNGDANVPAGPETAFFTDVPTDHWALKYVEYLHAQNVVGGYGNGEYRPLVAVTRDQMAVYVQRAFDLPI